MTTNNGNNTYIFDAESPTELARLINQDRLTTRAMGGPFSGLREEEVAGLRHILDLACGPGGWVLDVAFTSSDTEVAGIDISRSMVEYADARARSQGLSNASFGVMDITQPLDFADESFDLVNVRFVGGVLLREHWAPFIAECTRLLRRGGILRLTEAIDWGTSTSPAFEQMAALLSQTAWRLGYGFSPDGRTIGTTTVLPRLLRTAGYQRLFVALDTTALLPFVLIRACLVYRGRAISLAWRALRHRSTQVSFEAYQPVLDQVRAMMPPGMVITLLADRGFVHQRLLTYCRCSGWHFRLRLPGDTLIHLSAQSVAAVRDLCPPAGQDRFFQEVSILGAAVGPVHLALAALIDQPDDPWFVVSDESTDARTLDEYGLRFGIEETFRDEKSGGYQIHLSQLATPEALERLILILAIATLHLTSLGVGVVQADKRRWVDPHWERRLSYMQLGWRWRRQQASRGWQAFTPFWLDPAPDPLPMLTPPRGVIRESHEVDPSTAV